MPIVTQRTLPHVVLKLVKFDPQPTLGKLREQLDRVSEILDKTDDVSIPDHMTKSH